MTIKESVRAKYLTCEHDEASAKELEFDALADQDVDLKHDLLDVLREEGEDEPFEYEELMGDLGYTKRILFLWCLLKRGEPYLERWSALSKENATLKQSYDSALAEIVRYLSGGIDIETLKMEHNLFMSTCDELEECLDVMFEIGDKPHPLEEIALSFLDHLQDVYTLALKGDNLELCYSTLLNIRDTVIMECSNYIARDLGLDSDSTTQVQHLGEGLERAFEATLLETIESLADDNWSDARRLDDLIKKVISKDFAFTPESVEAQLGSAK